MRSSISFLAILLTPMASFAEAEPVVDDLSIYSDVIAPIFEAKCVSCHGEEKVKGKLRMDSYEAVVKGGSSGESFVPGDEDSELIYRIVTDDEDDHMPPENKTQLTADEIEVIKWWVAKGGKEKAKVGELAPDATVAAHFKAVVVAAATAVVAEGNPDDESKVNKEEMAANVKKIAAIAETVSLDLGAPILAIANGSDKVQFNAVNVTKTFGDEEIAKLAPLSGALVDVNLARTQVTDAGLAALGKMGSIKRLRLENTGISDAGLSHIANLGELEYLNLYGTEITDAGIAQLSSLKGLKKLFLWDTEVTREAAEKLVGEIPDLKVNLGWDNEVPGSSPAPGEEEKPATEKES